MKNTQAILSFFCAVAFLIGCSTNHTAPSKAELVDMLMGVQGNSSCVIGPQLPHGSINPSPQTPRGRHDGYAPDEPVRGFGQLHVSGTGWGRYGQILLSPQTGFNPAEDGHDSPKSNEVATPYHYSVNLTRYNVKVEVAPTRHCAAYRFIFPQSDSANILLDVAHNIPQHIVPEIGGKFLGGEISPFSTSHSRLITGWGEYAGGFGSGEAYRVYFAIQLGVENYKLPIRNNGKECYAQISFPENTDTVNLKIGISMKSVANAEKFLHEEVADFSLEEVRAQAKTAWENVLNKVEIKDGTLDEQRIFYTALYHSYLMPRIRTGDNPRWDSDVPHLDDHYCVWDTWRTKYPLMTLLNESFTASTISSFIDRYEHDGKCTPTFTSSLEWDWKQGGDDVDNIIADAFVKNVQGFDRGKAYELMKHNAFHERSENYRQKGWESEPAERMSCSYTMEYAYNDFCVSEAAQIMGDTVTANVLKQRSKQWVKLFDKDLESKGFKGFIAPHTVHTSARTAAPLHIDPAEKYGSWEKYFYEGNSWVYTLFAPHDFERLIALCGGKDEMLRRLTYGFDNHLIEMDNEPGFLSPFIFTHCDRPDLTAKYISKIHAEEFSLTGGYPDNEDSGAMGSWYVFTSIGLFPNAGQDFYYLLPPAFDEVSITRENGAKIHVKTVKTAHNAQHIKSVNLNGKELNRFTIKHSELENGAEIAYMIE
jgi:predicted alpha-1,2-mannosidase